MKATIALLIALSFASCEKCVTCEFHIQQSGSSASGVASTREVCTKEEQDELEDYNVEIPSQNGGTTHQYWVCQ